MYMVGDKVFENQADACNYVGMMVKLCDDYSLSAEEVIISKPYTYVKVTIIFGEGGDITFKFTPACEERGAHAYTGGYVCYIKYTGQKKYKILMNAWNKFLSSGEADLM